VALEADFGAGFSVDVVEPDAGSAFVVVSVVVGASVVVESAADFLPDDLRSTFTQPEPLNTIAGATNALRIGAPQVGHVVGPASCTPCMTSVRWPLTHTYS
jgi:hypothetical protein